MDWYLGCAFDDLVVPSDQDMVDMFPSPNGWSQWELSPSEAFEPMSKYFITPTNFIGTGLNFNGKSQNKVGLNLFENQHDEHCINPKFCQEFKEGSVNQDTSSCDVSDYQLDDLDMTNQMNDSFLQVNSSHDIGADTCTGPFNFHHPDFESDDYGVLPTDNLFEKVITACDYDPSHLFGLESSKYLKTHAFSPSVGGGARLYTIQFPELRDNPPSPTKAQYAEVSVSPKFEITDEHIDEGTPCEASILQELENALTQMPDHTRICFRDALYRLAESSKQRSMDLIMERSDPLMVSDGNFRSGNMKNMEVETNAIDRAVSKLMFYKMGTNVQNLPHCHSSSSGDAEVPIFS